MVSSHVVTIVVNSRILLLLCQSPAMQSLLNDHDFMRSLLKMDPRLSKAPRTARKVVHGACPGKLKAWKQT